MVDTKALGKAGKLLSVWLESSEGSVCAEGDGQAGIWLDSRVTEDAVPNTEPRLGPHKQWGRCTGSLQQSDQNGRAKHIPHPSPNPRDEEPRLFMGVAWFFWLAGFGGLFQFGLVLSALRGEHSLVHARQVSYC